MELRFTPEAWEDYLYWQSTDKKILTRINELLKEITRTPFAGKGKPEPLRHELQGCWSRRINHEHRLVYQANERSVFIVTLRFHYA